MEFHFEGRTSAGKVVTGLREGGDRLVVARELRDEGVVVTRVVAKESSAGKSIKSFFNRPISLRDVIIFASNLSSMINAGLPLSRALGVLERQSSSQNFRRVMRLINESISKGLNLSTALEMSGGRFPSILVSLVRTGEESGNLPKSLTAASDELNRLYELRKKVKSAMVYPAIVVSLALVVGVLMMIFVVPPLIDTFNDLNVPLPPSTRLLINTSKFITEQPFTLAGFFLLAVVIGSWFWRSRRGRRWWHWLILRLPVISTVAKELNNAITMRTMASLISSGVAMTESLKITSAVLQNVWYEQAVAAMAGGVEKGETLSELLAKNPRLFLPLTIEMSEVGEETGNLSELLNRGAAFFEDEISRVTKNLSSLIEPVLMVIIGILVGFFALSMIGPIYSLSEAI